MLEGKPARVDEEETMDAIRRILTDFEDLFPEPASANTQRDPAPEPAAAQQEPTLTPVATVETKIASAKFTTVPNVERLSAVARVMESSMSKPERSAAPSQAGPDHTGASKSASSKKRGWKMPSIPRPSISLPKIALPAFSRPKVSLPTLFKRGGATRSDRASALPNRAGLSLPKMSLPKLSLPKLSLSKLSLPGRAAPQMQAPELPAKAPGRTAKPTNRMPQLREATERTAPKLSREGLLSLRYHITPLRAALAGMVLALLIWPALMILLLVLALFVLATPFLILGADGVWEKVAQLVTWYCARHPDRKDAVYDGLDAMALRWDAVLDRLPEDLVEGLYMPDFANMEEAQDHHDKVVLDRLSQMRKQA